jgi:hypothetical protein
MTFSFVPACNAPTVTTAASAAAASRETQFEAALRLLRHDHRVDAGLWHRSMRAAPK